jgi:hypothetical protein
MTCDVGAVAIVYQKQVQSSIEMRKSFRQNNQSSTIVLCTDGLVDEIDDICKEYSCSAVINHNQLGYPASHDIEIPIEYFRRLLLASQLISEKYFINLEPDCLVTGKITIPYEDYDFIINQDPTVQWLYYFEGKDILRSSIIDNVLNYYKKNNVYSEQLFDKIMGGGGDIYNKNITDKILHEWQLFKTRTYDFKHLCESAQKVWYHDMIVSFQVPFHCKSRYWGIDYAERTKDLNLSDRIFHRCKQFYT